MDISDIPHLINLLEPIGLTPDEIIAMRQYIDGDEIDDRVSDRSWDAMFEFLRDERSYRLAFMMDFTGHESAPIPTDREGILKSIGGYHSMRAVASKMRKYGRSMSWK